jgi:hypothetical protein
MNLSSRRRDGGAFPWRVHPIWRGVGCLLLIVTPVIAFGLADTLISYAVAENPNIFNSLDVDLRGPENLFVKIGAALVLSFILYLVFSILGSLFYSLAGGPKDERMAELTKKKPFRR